MGTKQAVRRQQRGAVAIVMSLFLVVVVGVLALVVDLGPNWAGVPGMLAQAAGYSCLIAAFFMPMRHRPPCAQPRRGQRGAAVVEFALVAVLFFTVLFSVIDFSYQMWVNLTMQHAVREGARYAITGRSDLDPDPDPSNSAANRYDAAIEEIKQSSMGLWDSLAPKVTFSAVDNSGAIVPLPAHSAGSPEQVLVVSVLCTSQPLTPMLKPFLHNGVYRFNVSATMRSEAYR